MRPRPSIALACVLVACGGSSVTDAGLAEGDGSIARLGPLCTGIDRSLVLEPLPAGLWPVPANLRVASLGDWDVVAVAAGDGDVQHLRVTALDRATGEERALLERDASQPFVVDAASHDGRITVLVGDRATDGLLTRISFDGASATVDETPREIVVTSVALGGSTASSDTILQLSFESGQPTIEAVEWPVGEQPLAPRALIRAFGALAGVAVLPDGLAITVSQGELTGQVMFFDDLLRHVATIDLESAVASIAPWSGGRAVVALPALHQLVLVAPGGTVQTLLELPVNRAISSFGGASPDEIGIVLGGIGMPPTGSEQPLQSLLLGVISASPTAVRGLDAPSVVAATGAASMALEDGRIVVAALDTHENRVRLSYLCTGDE